MKNVSRPLSVILFILIWEIWAFYSKNLRFFVSSPSASFEYGITHFQNIIYSTLITSIEALSGFFLAIIFSFLIMLFCLLYPNFLKIILPIFITSQILPIITLAPFFIILFGMGLMSKIAMVVLMCFFPIFINFSTGVNSISQNTQELLYVYNAGKLFRIFKIIIPLSMPYLFSGLKVGTTMAIMGAIVSEFVGAKDGLGKNLYLAPKNSQPELMICSVILITLLGWLLFKSVDLTEKKFGNWYSNNDNQ
jgi:ABC-type nitrate/sulfonate/bicarbonate transport system permease component